MAPWSDSEECNRDHSYCAQLAAFKRERDEWWQETANRATGGDYVYGALLAESRLLLENWHSCAEMLGLEPKDITPLTAAEVERVRLEREVVKAAKQVDSKWPPLVKALAALSEED